MELINVARPTKWRKIENVPAVQFFVPSETELQEVPENMLKLEELEAIRLKDLGRSGAGRMRGKNGSFAPNVSEESSSRAGRKLRTA